MWAESYERRRKPGRQRHNPHTKSPSYTGCDATRAACVAIRTQRPRPLPITTQTRSPASQSAHGDPDLYRLRRNTTLLRRNQRRTGPNRTDDDANPFPSVAIRTRKARPIQVATQHGPPASQPVRKRAGTYGLRRGRGTRGGAGRERIGPTGRTEAREQPSPPWRRRTRRL